MTVKEKIIAASLELFSTKGYEKTSVSDIIKATGSSRGGFYHHYKDKAEILDDIMDQYLNDFMRPFEQVMHNHQGSMTTLFMALFEFIIDFKIGQVPEWSTLNKLFSFKGNHVLVLKISKQVEKSVIDCYSQILTKGIEHGEFKIDYVKPLANLWTRELLEIISQLHVEGLSDCKEMSVSLTEHIRYMEGLLARELSLAPGILILEGKVKEYFIRMKEVELYDSLV